MSAIESPANGYPVGPFVSTFSGRMGMARRDITPPVGIYARNWGAAKHDVAESVHRPLSVGAMVFQSLGNARPLVLVESDLGVWPAPTAFQGLRERVLERFSLSEEQFIFALTHTHSSPRLSPPDGDMPGGGLLADWISIVHEAVLEAIQLAFESSRKALLDWGVGCCRLAAARDLRDPTPGADRRICGYDPTVGADDTLLVGRVSDEQGRVFAVLVNYACHPTTLAWENRAVSPDYIGAMREVVSAACSGAPTFFVQGASGELAPKFQYVGDTTVADRHGRHLGYAVLATLEDMEPPGMRLAYDRIVESGAPLAVWRHERVAPSSVLKGMQTCVSLPLKPLPTAADLDRQFRAETDRALAERLRRKRDIRLKLGDGARFDLPLYCWRLGDAILIGAMTEAYSHFQVELRRRFPEQHIVCLNLINGSIGYLPPAALYDEDVYQVWQTPFERGSAELMLDAATDLVRQVIALR